MIYDHPERLRAMFANACNIDTLANMANMQREGTTMQKCAICDTKNPEPLARLPSILLDLRIRSVIVNVATPRSGEYCHASCVLRLRSKIEAKEKRNAIHR